jgi:hypothetical protein
VWGFLVLPWLYCWLRGGWFARVLAMLFWFPAVIICSGKILNGVDAKGYELPATLVYLVASGVVAWLISSLPTYLRARWTKEDSGQSLMLR